MRHRTRTADTIPPSPHSQRTSRTPAAAFLLTVILLTAVSPGALARTSSRAREPELAAASAILIDAATGTVLYTKNDHQSRPMASTTKIMTALVTLERCSPDEIAIVSKHALEVRPSILGLTAGERISVADLLEALLVKSANDAAVALAEHVAGTEEAFVALMNERAVELGCRDTQFRNPHGLYDKDHRSSAADLAVMAREAMRLPLFRRLVATRRSFVERPDGTRLELSNHNRLLFRYDDADGIKTGFVRQSGRCLVASASRDGWRLIAVLLDSGRLWQDAESLLDYGFAEWQGRAIARAQRPFSRVRVRGGRVGSVRALATSDLVDLGRAGQTSRADVRVETDRLFAPVRRGQKIGRVVLVRDGQEVGSTLLLASSSVGPALWFSICKGCGTILLTLTGLVGAIKIYVKITKAARRRRYRFQTQG